MRNHDPQMTSRQKNLANSLAFHLQKSRESLLDLMKRLENFEGGYAELVYRCLEFAYNTTGNIDDEDFAEIAKSNLD